MPAYPLEPEGYLPLVVIQPSPTPTPTPTVTPTPTATAIPPGVHILDTHSSFTHSDQGYSVVGEIFNNTENHLWNIQVSARFYNSQGKRVNTISRPLDFVNRLKPGLKVCFALDEWVDDLDWEYYEFDPVSYFADDIAPPEVSKHDLVGTELAGRYFLSGKVRNDHSADIDNTRVQGALYDENGVVLDCRWDYVINRHLAPGVMSPFEIEFTHRDDGYGDVDSYKVRRQAEEYHR
jgi:hypothetical protein